MIGLVWGIVSCSLSFSFFLSFFPYYPPPPDGFFLVSKLCVSSPVDREISRVIEWKYPLQPPRPEEERVCVGGGVVVVAAVGVVVVVFIFRPQRGLSIQGRHVTPLA